VLSNFGQNSARYRRFNNLVREIFPHVHWIDTRSHPQESGKVGVVISPFNTELERPDLHIPLEHCGTGVAQILAMLYVVVNSDSPQVIIIDEPQSFLHPGAARKLIGILKDHPQHQYIIATHSPTIISAADPERIFILKLQDGETFVQTMDASAKTVQKHCLLELGATLSDVFGMDHVIWVEGATEEACFPLILEKLAKQRSAGTLIKAVVATGDFERWGKRKAELAVEVYEGISGNSLIPPAIGFIFDAEGRTQQEKDDLQRRAKGRLHFLRRRMYENYLLNPGAIAAVAANDPGFVAALISEEIIRGKLNIMLAEQEYYHGPAPTELREQLVSVHGAKVLKRLFNELSGATVQYLKATHSEALTEWVIQNAAGDLNDVVELLTRMVRSTAPEASSTTA
jgi:hypothetical protein